MSSLPLFPSGPTLTDAPAPELRSYQERAVRLAAMHIEQGKKRILLTLPTASGKMVIVASVIRRSTVPVLFVAHRMELLDQLVEQLARQGITHIGVLRGDDERENASASIQIASIETLARRNKPPAGLIFIDEAHRSLADTYVEHVFNAYPEAIIIGLTASPCRSDGRPLGEVWQVLETVASYSELLKRPEWMATPDCYSSPVRADLSGVATKHGDYDEPALAEVMSQDRLVGDLLRHWLELAHRYPVFLRGSRCIGATTAGERRRTFIFAVDIRHSKAICERFSQAGVRIAHLDGTTPEDERRAMLLALRNGELECISNCNVLLEGVDAPEVKCVVHARPTQSLVLWLQSVGRILRPWRAPRSTLDGSNDPTPMWVPPLILDHAGNWDRHGPPHEDRVWSLSNVVGRKSSSKPYKLCRACFAYVQLSLHICPYCKYAFTAQEMREPPRETADKLVYRSDAPDHVRREFFNRMATIARVRGFKPGFASAKHKEHYGEWPPSAWSDVLKSEFATDTQWQARLESRLLAKAEEEAAWDATTEDHSLSVGVDPAEMAPGSVAEDVETDTLKEAEEFEIGRAS